MKHWGLFLSFVHTLIFRFLNLVYTIFLLSASTCTSSPTTTSELMDSYPLSLLNLLNPKFLKGMINRLIHTFNGKCKYHTYVYINTYQHIRIHEYICRFITLIYTTKTGTLT